ncbi:hypothetical protein ACFL16_01905, partial [Patescibacteria group bacterium]
AKCLINGDTYDEIRERLGVGYQTVSGVEQWLDARNGAYRKVLLRWVGKSRKNKESGVASDYKGESLLDKYPQHRFLKEILGL